MNAPFMPKATIDDLMRYDGKAELIDGRIVPIMSPGDLPNLVAGFIYRRLWEWIEASAAAGRAYTDGMIFAVGRLSSGRQSFSADAAFDPGPFPANRMRGLDHAPAFAVEVRSENDYSPAADREYDAKRADYFEAGTKVVWDVDPIDQTVTCYSAANPLTPQVFRMGEVADAEPAVPGWRVRVDAIMF